MKRFLNETRDYFDDAEITYARDKDTIFKMYYIETLFNDHEYFNDSSAIIGKILKKYGAKGDYVNNPTGDIKNGEEGFFESMSNEDINLAYMDVKRLIKQHGSKRITETREFFDDTDDRYEYDTEGGFQHLPATAESLLINGDFNEIPAQQYARRLRLKTVSIVAPIKVIGVRAFQSCHRLEEVNLPRTLETISKYAFYDCLKLNQIILPYGLQVIENSAFGNCRLEYIQLPSTLQYIGENVFTHCLLETVTIPQSVKHIGDAAFDIPFLHDVTYTGTKSQWKQIDIRQFAGRFNKRMTVHCTDGIFIY